MSKANPVKPTPKQISFLIKHCRMTARDAIRTPPREASRLIANKISSWRPQSPKRQRAPKPTAPVPQNTEHFVISHSGASEAFQKSQERARIHLAVLRERQTAGKALSTWV